MYEKRKVNYVGYFHGVQVPLATMDWDNVGGADVHIIGLEQEKTVKIEDKEYTVQLVAFLNPDFGEYRMLYFVTDEDADIEAYYVDGDTPNIPGEDFISVERDIEGTVAYDPITDDDRIYEGNVSYYDYFIKKAYMNTF
jgi:hypothetical protein